MRNYCKDGSGYRRDPFMAPVLDESGAVTQFIFAQYDISAVMQFEAELEFQATHDTLTSLVNRGLLSERLAQAIANSTRGELPIWVIFVDLDRFKFINDTLGHEAGDMQLKTLAGRLPSAACKVDTVTRIGGDEFVVVLPDQADQNIGLATVCNIMAAVAQPLEVYGYDDVQHRRRDSSGRWR